MTAVKSLRCSCQVSWQPNTHENITWIDIFFPLSGNARVKQLNKMSYQMTRMASCIARQSQLFLPFKRVKGENFELAEKENKWNPLVKASQTLSSCSDLPRKQQNINRKCQGEGPSWGTSTAPIFHMHLKSQSQLQSRTESTHCSIKRVTAREVTDTL